MSPDNTSLIEWVIGIIAAALSAAIGHLHIRINNIEQSRMSDARDARRDADAADNRIWGSIDDLRKQLLMVATKDDLLQMERRLGDQIKEVRQ